MCAISRLIGWMLTGRKEMLCSLLADAKWFAGPVDAAFYLREWQSYHCARMREWERNG
ncbi:MAG: hypothetical protein ACQEUZ_06230 [Pseudomonadota bacterium]